MIKSVYTGNMEFKDYLKEALTRSGMNQNELAAQLGVHYTAVSTWVLGKSHPRNDKIDRVAKFIQSQGLDFSVEEYAMGQLKELVMSPTASVNKIAKSREWALAIKERNKRERALAKSLWSAFVNSLLLEHKLTTSQFALKVGCTASQVEKWVRGESLALLTTYSRVQKIFEQTVDLLPSSRDAGQLFIEGRLSTEPMGVSSGK